MTCYDLWTSRFILIDSKYIKICQIWICMFWFVSTYAYTHGLIIWFSNGQPVSHCSNLGYPCPGSVTCTNVPSMNFPGAKPTKSHTGHELSTLTTMWMNHSVQFTWDALSVSKIQRPWLYSHEPLKCILTLTHSSPQGLPDGCLHLSNSCPLNVGALASYMLPLLPTPFFFHLSPYFYFPFIPIQSLPSIHITTYHLCLSTTQSFLYLHHTLFIILFLLSTHIFSIL